MTRLLAIRAVAATAALAVALIAPAFAADAAPPPSAPIEVHDDFTYGPLRFRVETLALNGSVTAHTKISIENLSHSVAHAVLASMAAARNGIGLELASAAGAKCDAAEKDIKGIKVVESEGALAVKAMTPVPALGKLTFSATFHCNTGRLSTNDTLSLKGRALTATEAGGFDIPLNFTGLKAKAK
ncbi:MAG: hypothetical protein GC190_07305 [Alphaproteobacteria bacterium]|nr:hypothetical protein [Alphaproteobacteria bacterium]